MKNNVNAILRECMTRYPALAPMETQMENAFLLIKACYQRGGTLFCCGNGGSCADSEHIVGELMKSFRVRRSIRDDIRAALTQEGEMGEVLLRDLEGALPAVSLCGHPALTTAYLNDTNPQLTFAQQLYGLGKKGDVLLAISTSGNSKNCLYAAITARAMGIPIVAMTGLGGGRLAPYADVLLDVPEKETFKVQEYHLPLYHCLCAMLEAEFFPESAER